MHTSNKKKTSVRGEREDEGRWRVGGKENNEGEETRCQEKEGRKEGWLKRRVTNEPNIQPSSSPSIPPSLPPSFPPPPDADSQKRPQTRTSIMDVTLGTNADRTSSRTVKTTRQEHDPGTTTPTRGEGLQREEEELQEEKRLHRDRITV